MHRNIRNMIKQFVLSKISLYIGSKHFSAGKTEFCNTVELELRSKCNGSCSFCPAAVQYDNRPDQLMPKETFEKIISDLSELEYSERICFFVNTEPLLDKRLPEFVRYTRKMCPKAALHIATNGLLLNNKIGRQLLDSGLDLLEINNYSDNHVVKPNIKEFMEEIAPKYPGKVFLYKRLANQQLNSRGGYSPNGRILERPLKAFCQRPFQKMIISVDGTVGLCEHDFYFSIKMGNVNEESLLEIWNSNNFNKIRQDLLHGERASNTVCSKCDYMGYRRISNPKAGYRGAYIVTNPSLTDRFCRLVHYLANLL